MELDSYAPLMSCLSLQVACCLLFAVSSGTVSGVLIRNYDPARHDRFENFPSDLSANASFYQGSEDWSGIGWSVSDVRKHFTLISPRHFVGARHFRPAIGSQVRFVNAAGVAKTYTVAALHDIFNDESPATATDLSLGELVETVAESDLVSTVPVLNLASEASYANQQILLSGRHSRAGRARIGSFNDLGDSPQTTVAGMNPTRVYSSTYRSFGFGGDDGRLEDGDSGGPSLVSTVGGLGLVGIHTALGEEAFLGTTTFTSIDTFVPHYLEKLDAAMEPLGYHVKRANVNTPALSLVLSGSADPASSSEGVSYELTIRNAANGEVAHNLRLALSCDAGATFASASGPSWVSEISSDGLQLRVVRGGLAAGEAVTVTVALDLPANPLSAVSLSAALTADGSATLLASETIEVAQSYQSWSMGLLDSSFLGDEDQDGLANEVEYLLGRDGAVPEGEPALSFHLSAGGSVGLSYRRRILTSGSLNELNLHHSLDLGSWEPVGLAFFTTSAAGYGFEEVQASWPLAEREFFRLQVE